MIRPSSSLTCVLAVMALSARAHASFGEPPEPPIGLVSYWPFDGDLNDARGNHDGTLMGTDTTPKFAAGKFGSGIDLDGIDQFVETTGDRLTLYTYRHGVSLSAWFRVDGFTRDWQTLISSPDASVARLGSERIMFFGSWPEDEPVPEVPGDWYWFPDLDDDEWHHLAVVGRGGADPALLYSFPPPPPTWELWVDGELSSLGMDGCDFLSMPVHIGNNPDTVGRSWDGLIDDVAIWDESLSPNQIAQIWNDGEGASIASLAPRLGLGRTPLQPGDADQDLDFDQFDIVQVMQAGTYLTGNPATWGEGDWNGGPGGYPGAPPVGNGFFDQADIVAALQTGAYLSGAYAAIRKDAVQGDEQTSIVYDARTGEIAVDPPANTELTSINIDSAAHVFTGEELCDWTGPGGGSFDNCSNSNLFKSVSEFLGFNFGSFNFGHVSQAGLSEQFVLGDLTVDGSLVGGGPLGDVDLIYIPEPSTVVLLALGILSLSVRGRWRDISR